MTSGKLPRLTHPAHILVCGRRLEGKSVMAQYLALSSGLPIALLDITHDATESLAQAGAEIHPVTPGHLPSGLGPGVWSLRPDMGHPKADDHMDSFVGFAMEQARKLGGLLLWCDEFGDMTTGNKTGRHMRSALHHARHWDMTMLLCCPRPMDIDRLGISQADAIYGYKLPIDADRERIAKTVGLTVATIDKAHEGLQPYHFTAWYRTDPDRIHICPPLPLTRPGAPRRSSAQTRAVERKVSR